MQKKCVHKLVNCMAKRRWVNIRTRVPAEIGEAINALASDSYPSYRIVRDIVVAHVSGTNVNALSLDTVRKMTSVAEAVGYENVDSLFLDLAAAFLRVHRYNTQQLQDDETTPAEEIRNMFENMPSYSYEKGMAIRKST